MGQIQAEYFVERRYIRNVPLGDSYFFRANVCESLIRSGISVFAMKIVKTRESIGAKCYDVIYHDT